MSEPMYLYSDQRRHIADLEDASRTRPQALCGALFLTEAEMIARFGRFLTGDLTLDRRIERAKQLPVCSWCSRRWLAVRRDMISLAGAARPPATGPADDGRAPIEER